MSNYFRELRNVELSTLYYLETELASAWSSVTLVKTFDSAYSKSRSLPIVCVSCGDMAVELKEIGNKNLWPRYVIDIDIFAKSDGQRLDLADFITDKLKDGWTYYVHSHPSGDNESLDRVADGKIRVEEWTFNGRVRLGFENIEARDKYRHSISVVVRRTK